MSTLREDNGEIGVSLKMEKLDDAMHLFSHLCCLCQW